MTDAHWYVIGALGAVLTTFGFVPQVIKMWRSKSVSDISLLTFIQFIIGVFFWAIYGIHQNDPIIISANIVSLSVLIIGILLYFRYSGRGTHKHSG